MALDRSWYNTLVDDSGDGLSGSVWDKADVNSLMNAIDAEIARLDGKLTAGTWTPALAGTGGGTGSYTVQSGVWSRADNLIQVGGRITVASKGSLAGALNITGLPFIAHGGSAQSVSVGYFAGIQLAFHPIGFINANTASIAMYAGFQQTSATPIDATHIVAGFDIIFGGSYRRA